MYEPLQLKEVNMALGEYEELDEEYRTKTRLEMQNIIKDQKDLEQEQ